MSDPAQNLPEFPQEDAEAFKYAFAHPDDPKNQAAINVYHRLTGGAAPHYDDNGSILEPGTPPQFAPININPPTRTESFARGAAQGATLGAQPIGSAALESGAGIVQSLFTGENAFGDEGHLGGLKNSISNYQRARDSSIQQNEAAQKEHPGYYLGGNLGGGMLPAALTGGEALMSKGVGTAASTVAPAFQRAVNMAQLSGLAGLVAGFSTSKGDLTKGDFGRVAKDSVDSAIQAGSLGPMVSSTIQNLGGEATMQEAANRKAFEAMRPTGQYATKTLSNGRDQEIGRTLLEAELPGVAPQNQTPILTPLASRQTMLERTRDKLEEVGQAVGYYTEQADKARSMDSSIRGVSTPEIIQDATRQIIDPLRERNHQQAADAVEKWVSTLPKGEISFDQAQKLKGTVGDFKAKFDRSGDNAEFQAFRELYGIFNQHIEGGVQSAFQKAAPHLENDFITTKDTYRNLLDAERFLESSTAAEAKNRAASLTDYLAGGIAASMGGPSGIAKAAAVGSAMAANKAARTYGNQALASFYDTLAGLARVGPNAINEFADNYAPQIRESAGRSFAAAIAQKNQSQKIDDNKPFQIRPRPGFQGSKR